MRNIKGEEDIFVRYLKPEMDIVEFDESVLTSGDVTVSGGEMDNTGGDGNLPSFPTITN